MVLSRQHIRTVNSPRLSDNRSIFWWKLLQSSRAEEALDTLWLPPNGEIRWIFSSLKLFATKRVALRFGQQGRVMDEDHIAFKSSMISREERGSRTGIAAISSTIRSMQALRAATAPADRSRRQPGSTITPVSRALCS